MSVLLSSTKKPGQPLISSRTRRVSKSMVGQLVVAQTYAGPEKPDLQAGPADLRWERLEILSGCEQQRQKETKLTKNPTLRSEFQLEKLGKQLKLERLYQDASHVMVQRSAGLQIDFDQIAALLCQEMQDAADRDVFLIQLQAYSAHERGLRIVALAAVSTLSVQVQQQRQELVAVTTKLCKTEVELQRINLLLMNSMLRTDAAIVSSKMSDLCQSQHAVRLSMP